MIALLHLSLLWAWNKRQILVSLSFFSFIFIYKPEENRAIMIQQKKPNCSLSDWLKGLDSLQVKSIVVLKRHWHSISCLLFKHKRHEHISFFLHLTVVFYFPFFGIRARMWIRNHFCFCRMEFYLLTLDIPLTIFLLSSETHCLTVLSWVGIFPRILSMLVLSVVN